MKDATKSKRISACRMASHEFRIALRKMRAHYTDNELLKMLVEQKRGAHKTAVKSFVTALLLSIVIMMNPGRTIDHTIFSVRLSIPVVYANVIVAMSVFSVILHYMSFFYLGEFQRLAVNKILKSDNVGAFNIFFEYGAAWSVGISQSYRFFKSSGPHMGSILIHLCMLVLPFLTLLGIIYKNSFEIAFDGLSRPEDIPFSQIISVLSLMFLLYPLAIIAISLWRFTFRRNTGFIRWVFLTSVYRRQGKMHPRVDHWLSERH